VTATVEHRLRLDVAQGFRERLIGWLGRSAAPRDRVLYLAHCRAIHTCFMRFRIDVIFVDRSGLVLAVSSGLRAWRSAVCFDAYAALEAYEGFVAERSLRPGDRVRFEPCGEGLFQLEEEPVMQECSESSRPSVDAARPGKGWVAAALLLAVALSACSTLDPTGEWRGLDRIDSNVARVDSTGPSGTSPAVSRVDSVTPAQPVAVSNVYGGPSEGTTGAPAVGPGPSIQTSTGKTQDAGISLEVIYMRAEAHYRNRRHEQARQDFERVLARDPRALHAWFRMGNLHHARGDLTAAVQAYRKTIELTPQNPIEHDSREKSLANLAIISLEQARVALEGLGDRQASDAARGRAQALSPLFEERQAALQAELSRFAPRPAQPTSLLREGRPGDRGAPILRIESHPPATSAR
jgi:uncharacterized membrane protein (UPF0127 family)/tetratricopeptide (TPR) repeat protein